MNRTALVCTTIGVLSLVTAVLVAGPLTPPAGAPASTYKTLQEVEPRIAINATNTPGSAATNFIITQPGSYYLTGNVSTAGTALAIRASNVTVDLNGYILASSGSLGVRNGIVVDVPSVANVRIMDGTVQGFSGDGIELQLEPTPDCRIENVVVRNCAGNGVDADRNCTIVNSKAIQNGVAGFAVTIGSIISNCHADANGVGFSVGLACVVTDCIATGNTFGFQVARGSALERCVARGNSQDGFNLDRVTATDCIARLNGGHGFVAGASAFTGCSAYENGQNGFNITGSRCRLTNCTAEQNSGHGVFADIVGDLAELSVIGSTLGNNTLSGITSEASTTVIDSTVSNNGGAGISVLASSTVRGCTVNTNTGSGIQASAATMIQNNVVSSNAPGAVGAGLAGILCTADDNRIEGNMIISNAQDGIRLNAAGNLVIRNTLTRVGTTINAVANNRIAQTITNPAPAFVSTDPNANFVY